MTSIKLSSPMFRRATHAQPTPLKTPAKAVAQRSLDSFSPARATFAAKATPAAPRAGLADQAVRAMGRLNPPSVPSNDASPRELLQYQLDSKAYADFKNLVTSTIQAVSTLPNPLPRTAAYEPPFPGPDATPQELARFQVDLQKFVSTVQSASTAAPAQPPIAQRPSTGDVAADAIRAIGDLREPAIPGPDATPQQLAQYEKDSKRYDRMMELMGSIIKKRDELQMSIIRKL